MRYLLGIDGGGTKTVICAEEIEGNRRKLFYSGALNINGQGEERTKRTILDIGTLLEADGYKRNDCVGIGIGAAGISNPDVATFLKQEFCKQGYPCNITLYGDQETALSAAFESCFGIILIAGTGSICYGKRMGQQGVRAGGYGHLIDDVGSGYAIGRDMLTAIVRAEDGRGEKTVLTSLIFKQLGINTIEELIQFLYQETRSKKEIAELARLINPAVSLNDSAAIMIEEKSANDLFHLFEAVKKKIPEEQNLALSGSVLLKNERIRSMLMEKIYAKYPEMNSIISKEEAAVGALRMVRKDMGGEKE